MVKRVLAILLALFLCQATLAQDYDGILRGLSQQYNNIIRGVEIHPSYLYSSYIIDMEKADDYFVYYDCVNDTVFNSIYNLNTETGIYTVSVPRFEILLGGGRIILIFDSGKAACYIDRRAEHSAILKLNEMILQQKLEFDYEQYNHIIENILYKRHLGYLADDLPMRTEKIEGIEVVLF